MKGHLPRSQETPIVLPALYPGGDCSFNVFLKPRNAIHLLPKHSHFCLNQVPRAPGFKTSMLKPGPANQARACGDPHGVEVSQEGFLREEKKRSSVAG